MGHFSSGLTGTLAQRLKPVFVVAAAALLAGLFDQLLQRAPKTAIGIRHAVTKSAGQIDRALVGTDGVLQAFFGIVLQIKPCLLYTSDAADDA